jgi:hypothetical protein
MAGKYYGSLSCNGHMASIVINFVSSNTRAKIVMFANTVIWYKKRDCK